MGSLAHLEKMGRELKCPICLSLLSSAVSLNCNHVFCNSCIVKSMKSGSNCPVCKIPYQRREVRPAPHMDNLVSIYKSMEDASGINIFMTQNASSTKSSDGKQQVDDGGCNSDEQDLPELGQYRNEEQSTIRGKGSRKTKSYLKNTDSVSVKPSFPTKKRVQVQQSSVSDNPAPSKQLVDEANDEPSKQCSTALKDKSVLNEKGEPKLSPFFWLSDKDAESLSQQSSGDQLADISFPNAPTFSDIKESDDEDTSRLSQLGEVQGKHSNGAELFDSEMFQWTQREHCSSPKMQAADSKYLDRIQVEKLKEAFQNKKRDQQVVRKTRSRKSRQNCEDVPLQPDLSDDGTKDANYQILCNQSNRRGGRTRNATKSICATSHTDLVGDTNVNVKESENIYQEQGSKNNVSSTEADRQNESCGEAISQKKAEKFCTVISSKDQMHRSVRSRKQKSGCVPNMHEEVSEIKKQADKDTSTQSQINLATGDSKKISGVKDKSRKRAIESQTCGRQSKCNKKVKVFSDDNSMDKEASEIQNQANKETKTEVFLVNCHADVTMEVSKLGDKSSKHSRELKSCNKKLKSNKKVKVSSDGSSKGDTVIEIGEGFHNVNGNQSIEKIKGHCSGGRLTDVQTLPALMNDVVLLRCDTVPNKIPCDFCHSSEESEASGEIVHYYHGRPVAADHNGGSKVIHSHKKCTEWAPNVYFEDDIAKNLEDELTRSRRIKCCCCGLKGAALGCYERTCRKSFHITCAKMTPQCRWDMEHFVMLCPIHATSKFPKESSKSEARKKSNPRKQPNAEHVKVAVKRDSKASQALKFSGSPKKLVLCCSTLADAEREHVAEFERLSGATVLKKWNSSVTHVIAPIDANGACRRTLKVLMGILEGKWILSMGWVNACMEAMKLVNEEPYEICVDIYGIRDGPRLGRLRLQNKEAKLFDGLRFYLMGDFEPSYMGYLQDLVIAAGGTVLHRKPAPESEKVLSARSPNCRTFIIYSLELPDQHDPSKKGTILNQRQSDAKALASYAGATAASNSWILNSIAASKLQCLSE